MSEEKKRGYEGRANSLAFTIQMDAKGKRPMFDSQGRQIYKCIPVPVKKGYVFCTECHDYKTFQVNQNEYGNNNKRCPDCGVTIYDCYVRTANNLWPSLK